MCIMNVNWTNATIVGCNVALHQEKVATNHQFRGYWATKDSINDCNDCIVAVYIFYFTRVKAMAHDKTERFGKLIAQTSADIGPGTYDATNISCPRRHLEEFYPFLCGAKRETLSVSKDAERFPGPDRYTIKEPQRHIPERVSIDFTDARFNTKVVEALGPGDYEISEDSPKQCGKIRVHPSTWRSPPGKLWLTRPPRSILPSAVSVPTKLDTGFHYNKYGVLVKNSPIKHMPTLIYNIPQGEANLTTLLYKGNFWSRMSGRTEKRPALMPGPGDYQQEVKKSDAQIQNEKIREYKRATSKQLRFLDLLYKRKMRENLPAPNNYNVKGCFDKYFKIPCKCDPYSLEAPPFGQTAKRLEEKIQSETPGPGAYEPRGQIKCVACIYPAPFGACSGRFQRISEDAEPAPCDYHTNVGNLAYESRKRFKFNYVKPVRFAPFNKIILEEENDYYTDDFIKKDEIKKCNVYHAAFKSGTNRFPKEKTGIPDPGAYEVIKAFKANRNKCNFPRNQLGTVFGSSSNRFPKKSYDIKTDVPEPTAYNVAGDIAKNVKGGAISLSRKEKEKPFIPGPNHYCIPPYASSSVLKKSFNVTLGKPEVIKNEEKRTHKHHCPCEKKKLRWFAQPIKEYQHCHPPRNYI